MSITPFNSVGGYSTGLTGYTVIDSVGGLSAAGGTFSALTRFTAGLSANYLQITQGATVDPQKLITFGNSTRGMQLVSQGKFNGIMVYGNADISIDASNGSSGIINVLGETVTLSDPDGNFYNSCGILIDNANETIRYDSPVGHEFNGGSVTINSSVVVNGGISAGNIVNSFNGKTGSVGGLHLPVGTTSNNLLVCTYPTGITSFSNKLPYYQSCNFTGRLSGAFSGATGNRTYFALHHITKPTTIQRIRVAGANTIVTGNAYLGIYSANAETLAPENPLYVSSSISVGSAYAYTTASSINYTLQPGYFYLFVTLSSNPTLYGQHKDYQTSAWGSGAWSSGYLNYQWIADTNGYTTPGSLPAAGVTLAMMDYHPQTYAHINVEYSTG